MDYGSRRGVTPAIERVLSLVELRYRRTLGLQLALDHGRGRRVLLDEGFSLHGDRTLWPAGSAGEFCGGFGTWIAIWPELMESVSRRNKWRQECYICSEQSPTKNNRKQLDMCRCGHSFGEPSPQESSPWGECVQIILCAFQKAWRMSGVWL